MYDKKELFTITIKLKAKEERNKQNTEEWKNNKNSKNVVKRIRKIII